MLKLEKIAKTRDLNVTLRQRPVFFNGTLAMALGLAIFIHTVPFLIFHIAPFKMGYDGPIFPPVHVAADFSQESPGNLISLEYPGHEPVPGYLIAPLPSSPGLPEISKSSPVKQMEWIKQQSLLYNPFLEIEEDKRMGDLALSPPEHKDYGTVKVHISGSLAGRPIAVRNTYEEELAQLSFYAFPIKTAVPHRCIYEVQVEDRTGEIFWHAPSACSEDKDIRALALNILLSHRFIPRKQCRRKCAFTTGCSPSKVQGRKRISLPA